MAKRIVITGDSSQLRQDFEQTAQSISGSLEKLGTKTQNLSLTGKQRASYLQGEARAAGVPQTIRDSRASIKGFEQERESIQESYLVDKKNIGGNRSITREERAAQLIQIKDRKEAADKGVNDDIEGEHEKIRSAQNVQSGLTELTRQLKLQESLQRSRHNEWSQLTKKELDAKAKELDKEMKGTTDPEKLDELRRDKEAIKRIQAERDDPKKEGGALEAIRRMAGMHYISQAVNSVGNAVGNTTGQMVGIGTNAISAGGANVNIVEGAIVAGAVATVGMIGLMLQKGKELETARDHLNGINAKGNKLDFGRSLNNENVGYDQIEFINKAAQVARSRGSGANLEARTTQQIMLNKGLGLEDSELSGINSMSKVGVENPTQAIQKLLSVLGRSALVNLTKDNFDVSALPHYLEKLVQLDQRSLEKTGRANNGRNVDLLGTVMGMGGIFKDYRTASSTVNSLQEQFGKKDPMERYFNQQAILQAHPELAGNIVGLKRMEENPDSASFSAMLNGVRKRAEAVGGKYTGKGGFSDDFVLQRLQDAGLGTYSKAFEYMQQGGRMTKTVAGNAGVDLNGRAIANTGTMDHIEAGMVNKIAQPGSNMIVAFNKAIEMMQGGASLMDVVQAVKDIPGQTKTGVGLSGFLATKGAKHKRAQARKPSKKFH